MENIAIQLKYGGPIVDRYDCTFDTEETPREREANDFLNEWLKTIAVERKRNPSYFERRPDKH